MEGHDFEHHTGFCYISWPLPLVLWGFPGLPSLWCHCLNCYYHYLTLSFISASSSLHCPFTIDSDSLRPKSIIGCCECWGIGRCFTKLIFKLSHVMKIIRTLKSIIKGIPISLPTPNPRTRLLPIPGAHHFCSSLSFAIRVSNNLSFVYNCLPFWKKKDSSRMYEFLNNTLFGFACVWSV